jgi:sulfur carrier protein
MIILSLNDQSLQLQEPATLRDLLDQQPPEGAFAVAINGDFVPRSQYAETPLQNGDQIDIVSPVGGG